METINKRLLSLLLAMILFLTSVPVDMYATGLNKDSLKTEITDIVNDGNNNVITLGNIKSRARRGSKYRLFQGGANTGDDETVSTEIVINLETLGLNFGDEDFNWDLLGEAGSFDVKLLVTKPTSDTPVVEETVKFNKGDKQKTIRLFLPKDLKNSSLRAIVPSFDQNIDLRVYVSGSRTTDIIPGNKMEYNLEISEISHPVIVLKVEDPYGTDLNESIAQALELKLSLENDHVITLPANNTKLNLRTLAAFKSDGIEELNHTGQKPNLSFVNPLIDNKIQIQDTVYKLKQMNYVPKGQKVTISGRTETVGGLIVFKTQPKIIVPKPDDNGNYPSQPEGYKRLNFYCETSTDAQDGKFTDNVKVKIIDVLADTPFADPVLQGKINSVEKPYPVINGKPDANKKFLKWTPALTTTGTVDDTNYRPVYIANGDKIDENEDLPDGVHKVKVTKDDSIKTDNEDANKSLYGKTYAVFDGKTLAKDKFPELKAEANHKDPKWMTEAAEAGKPMEKIDEPWKKVINKDTTFKATAGADAATQIGQNGLKAVDTTALQGQDLD